ncbi:MAG TPA: class I SAM-dependent methyltransferase [Xanthobacteraceae bacterium]|jgi:SAM-dependent methyltransferase|nr:class I SAM-dependent methyltransferase [Xanthobacteraceae bacterium]
MHQEATAERLDKLVSAYSSSWEHNARSASLFSILGNDRNHDAWREQDFFDAGSEEVGRVLRFMETSGIRLQNFSSFLDFGCGVGRNTRALIGEFKSGVGVDIATNMIADAVRFAKDDERQARYVVNKEANLGFVAEGSIDFVYCHMVLQHNPAPLQQAYIAEFLRVLSPGGVAAFQIPTGQYARNLVEAIKQAIPPRAKVVVRSLMGAKTRSEMHVLPASAIEDICAAGGTKILASQYTNSTHPNHEGRIEFMSREAAISRIKNGATPSYHLSQFFFVQKSPAR